MKIARLIWIVVMLFSGLAVGRTQEIKFSAFPIEKLKVSDITWRGPFGYVKNETNRLFVPLTQGLVLTPQSTNFVSLIASWLAKHTNAEAIVIFPWDGVLDSKMKSVWIDDGEDSLNVYLVRMGGCPAFTMLLNPGDKTPLTQKKYLKAKNFRRA